MERRPGGGAEVVGLDADVHSRVRGRDLLEEDDARERVLPEVEGLLDLVGHEGGGWREAGGKALDRPVDRRVGPHRLRWSSQLEKCEICATKVWVDGS